MSLPSELRNIWSLFTQHPLTRGRPSSAVARFLRWQIASRISKAPALVPFVNESRLVVKRGMTGATGNIYVGLMEFEDMGFVLHFLNEHDLFADIGANVGAFTILASAARTARTVAVEPVSAAAAALMDNVRLNDVSSRVELHQVAVGETEGVVAFTTDLDTTNHVVSPADAGSACAVQVPITTLDRLFFDRPPTLIKIDVEGYEWPVLNGSAATLSSPGCQAVILEINGSGVRYGIQDSQIDEKVRAFGFAPFAYEPLTRELSALETFGTRNTIYIKDAEAARLKLTQAPPFRVLDRSI